jgi:hypothetical protein
MTYSRFTFGLTALALVACKPTAPSTEAPAAPIDRPGSASPADSVAPANSAVAPFDATPAPAAVPTKATASLAVDGEGLRLFDPSSGAARPLPFGTPRAQLLAALAMRDPPTFGTQECPAGALAYAAWPDGLKLYFQKDQFIGWALDDRARGAISTAAGVGPGATRSAVEEAIVIKTQKTSLGTEFSSGGLYGLFDGAGAGAKVSDLWAGVGCVFR